MTADPTRPTPAGKSKPRKPASTAKSPKPPKPGEWREDVLAVLKELLLPLEDVALGQMMGHPSFFYALDGGKRKMFALVWGPGVALKLPPDLVAEVLAEPCFRPFSPGGFPMGGWVVLDPGSNVSALNDYRELLEAALDCVSG